MSTQVKVICDNCGQEITDGQSRVSMIKSDPEATEPPVQRDYHAEHAPAGVDL